MFEGYPELYDKFLGVKIVDGINAFYGWIRVDIHGGASLTVKDYAINTVNNEFINAGGGLIPGVTELEINDIGDNRDASDIVFSFDKVADEWNIIGYRIYLVEQEQSDTLSAGDFYSITDFESIEPAGIDVRDTLQNSLKDINGNPIQNSVTYRAAVLTISNSSVYSDSLKVTYSNVLILHSYVERVSDLLVVDNGNNNTSEDLQVSFIPVQGSSEYELLIAPDYFSDTISQECVDTIGSASFYQIPNDSIGDAFYLESGILDVYGNSLISQQLYKAYVIAVADGINYDVNSISIASAPFALHNPNYPFAGQSFETWYCTDLYPDVVLSPDHSTEEYIIDLNNDGNDDFRVTSYLEYSPSHYYSGDGIEPLNNNEVADIHQIVFDSLEQISPMLDWTNESIVLHTNSSVFGESSSYGGWDGLKYIGIRLIEDNDTLYGWIRLSLYWGATIDSYCVQQYETSLDGVNSKDQVFVYPNPADNTVTFLLNTNTIGSIYILSHDGRLLKSYSINGHLKTVELDELPDGVYIARIDNGFDMYICKFVILR
jgi:hypothetical protein